MPEPTPEAPRRLTLSAIVEKLIDRGGRDYSQVSITRNAKGETQIDVTVRTGEEDVTTAEEAAEKAKRIYDDLCKRYPHETGQYGGSGISLTRNAKGDTQIDVTLKAGTDTDRAGWLALVKQADESYERMRLTYPGADGFVGSGARVPQSDSPAENDARAS